MTGGDDGVGGVNPQQFEELVKLVRAGFAASHEEKMELRQDVALVRRDLQTVAGKVGKIEKVFDGNGHGPLLAQLHVLRDRVGRHEKWVYVAIVGLVTALWAAAIAGWNRWEFAGGRDAGPPAQQQQPRGKP